MIQRFDSVWDALADTPKEAAQLKARSQLLMALQEKIDGMPLKEASVLLGVTVSRISEIRSGKFHLFSLDKLVILLAKAGYQVKFEIAAIH
ncbi:XRE family transcriptional regulator [Erwinia sp. MYb375]|uniref:helix-turn-helix domain-containing protein n=1 Tax=unclassified Erwinia TaxID=2622719 RepID=UPI0030963929